MAYKVRKSTRASNFQSQFKRRTSHVPNLIATLVDLNQFNISYALNLIESNDSCLQSVYSLFVRPSSLFQSDESTLNA